MPKIKEEIIKNLPIRFYKNDENLLKRIEDEQKKNNIGSLNKTIKFILNKLTK
jgi:hypothetical protein